MLVAIDQGTSKTTVIVFDLDGSIRGHSSHEFPQYFPHPGWVEHDADEIWSTTLTAVGGALADAEIHPRDVAAIGITNQRETVVCWDPITGQPLHRAIVWQDRRTAERCGELVALGLEAMIRERTGLLCDPYFSGTKIEWLLRNVEGLRDKADTGRVVFGTIDSWLAFKLCGEHISDVSNASRTLLFDIYERRWHPELLDIFEISPQSLPTVVANSAELGATRPELFDGVSIPLCGMAGDQQAALFGQACLSDKEIKATFGTGSFVLLNAGETGPRSPEGLLTTIAWQQGQTISYALEASVFVTGAAVQWLRDGLGLIETASETESLARSLTSNEGVHFVPALTGLGSPYWDPYARGTIVGLTRGSTKAHIARATLEAIAYQTHDAIRAIEAASGSAPKELRADGGATANAWLMQFQADILGIPVVVPVVSETTALGAAALAGVGAGVLKLDDVRMMKKEKSRYEPSMSSDTREFLLAGWQDAVARARG